MITIVLYFLLIQTRVDGNVCDTVCECEANMMTCTKGIPVRLPDNVTHVILDGLDLFLNISRINQPFQHESWKQLLSLVITQSSADDDDILNQKDFTIWKGLFKNMVNLTHLTVDTLRFTNMEKSGYVGLENLKSLDLSGCKRLNVDAVTKGLENVPMPKLQTLRMRGVASHTLSASHFNKAFFDVLLNKPVSELDLSNTHTDTLDSKAFAFSLPNLRALNIDHGQYLLLFVIMGIIKYPRAPAFLNLENISANYAVFPDGVFHSINVLEQLSHNNSDPMLSNIRSVSLRGIIPREDSVEFNFEKIGNVLCPKLVFINRKNISWTPPVCKRGNNYDTLQLDSLDFSDNGVVGIGPEFDNFFRNIKNIDFSKNRLGDGHNWMTSLVVQTTHKPLNILRMNISDNRIKKLMRGLLYGNPKLISIDLSHNLLESFDLIIPKNHPLQLVNLSYNRIVTIDTGIWPTLQLSSLNESGNATTDIANSTLTRLKLDLTGNVFHCTCENKGLIEFLIVSSNIVTTRSLTCIYEGHSVQLKVAIIPKIAFLCKWPQIRTTIIVGTSILSIIIFVVIYVLVHRCRKLKEKRRFEKLMHKYKNDPDKPEYPVFLSFSSTDQNIAHRHILPRLNKGLQQVLQTNDTCVATGDLNFLPGFTVAGEIIRCVEASRVVVFCISRAFCRSEYCKDELVVADFTRTPVILLFLEEIEVQTMPKLLQKYFYTSARCKITQEDGRHFLVPAWNTLCRAIVQLFDVQDD